jgi:NADPH:quinone reductase-like Zn-dependent oxidoreductase
MLAVTVESVDAADPLAGLAVGSRPEPQAPEAWVLVHVRAASLNHHDVWTLKGVGVDVDRLPIVLGCDAAGVTEDGREVIVHAVVQPPGSTAGLLDPRATLLSEQVDGTFAEAVAVPADNLVDKPSGLTFAEAACLPTAYLTAYRALFSQAGLKAGQRLLVQGAGGGVATAAIILGNAVGLDVYVTSRSETRREQAVALGAVDAFAPDQKLPVRVDAVLESVGEATWEQSLRALEPGGTVVVIGATSGARPTLDLMRVFYRQVRILGSLMGTKDELADVSRLLAGSTQRPAIDSVFALSDGRAAFERMISGDAFGKVVLAASEA